MSLRRPRIRSAVNLAALANGRRKEKPPEEVPKQPEPETEPETASHDVEPEKVEKSAVESGSRQTKGDVSEIGNTEIENVTLNGHVEEPEKVDVTNHDIKSDANIAVVENNKTNGTNGEMEHCVEHETNETDKSGIGERSKDSNSETRSDSDPKKIENPFSPPPARPAPMGRFKSRFRPNLNENRNRIRRFSGTLSDLVSLKIK